MKKTILVYAESECHKYQSDESIGLGIVQAFLKQMRFQCNVISGNNNEVISKINEQNPNYIGFYTTWSNLKNVIKISEHLNEGKLIAGGPEVSFRDVEFLEKNTKFDYVVRGEGHKTLAELISGIPVENIDGLTYRKKENILRNKNRNGTENLDELPIPDREQVKKLFSEGSKYARIITSSGCPNVCTFCLQSSLQKMNNLEPKRREFGLKRVLGEMDELYNLGARYFMFSDDEFIGNSLKEKKRCGNLAEAIGRNWKDINFYFMTSVSNVLNNKELIIKLKNVGLKRMLIGAENINPHCLRDIFHKYTTNKDSLLNSLNFLVENSIAPWPSFILLNPFSTCEEIEENLDFIKRLPKEIGAFFGLYANLAELSHGTELFEKTKEEGLYNSNPLDYNFQDSRLKPVAEILGEVKKEINEIDSKMMWDDKLLLLENPLKIKIKKTNINFLNNLIYSAKGKKDNFDNLKKDFLEEYFKLTKQL